jgi:uncharacterized protein YecE (DUF72 family)
VQLPPSLEFLPDIVERFLVALRQRHSGYAVAEPRHPGWFTEEAEQLLRRCHVGRVAASYSPEFLRSRAERLMNHAQPETPVWCIFDNTALGAATGNALELLRELAPSTRFS